MQRALSPTANPTRSHSHQPSKSPIPAPKLNLSPPSRPGSSVSNKLLSGLTTSFTAVLVSRTGRAGATLYGGASPDHTPARSSPAAVVAIDAVTRCAVKLQVGKCMYTTASVPLRRVFYAVLAGLTAEHQRRRVHVDVLRKPGVRAHQVGRAGHGGRESCQWPAAGFTFEQLDPPARRPAANAPKPDEVRGQYVVSNALSRKVITCRLTTVGRGENISKKVMCRVGGGTCYCCVRLRQNTDRLTTSRLARLA